MPLFTIGNFRNQKDFLHLCYEGVCDEALDPIDFCDLYLISYVISKKRAKGFHSHLISRSLSFISCAKALIQDAHTSQFWWHFELWNFYDGGQRHVSVNYLFYINFDFCVYLLHNKYFLRCLHSDASSFLLFMLAMCGLHIMKYFSFRQRLHFLLDVEYERPFATILHLTL